MIAKVKLTPVQLGLLNQGNAIVIGRDGWQWFHDEDVAMDWAVEQELVSAAVVFVDLSQNPEGH